MNQELGVFLTPLFLLPGVGLLVMSTSARYGQLHAELHHLEAHEVPDRLQRCRRLLRRGLLFRRALLGLYLAVSILTLTSLIGGVLSVLGFSASGVILVLTCVGIFAVVFATLQLVIESRLSAEVLLDHARDIETKETQKGRTA